jgi:hypothetical protein
MNRGGKEDIYREPIDGAGGSSGGECCKDIPKLTQPEIKKSNFSWPTYFAALGTIAVVAGVSAGIVINNNSKFRDENVQLRSEIEAYHQNQDVTNQSYLNQIHGLQFFTDTARNDLYGDSANAPKFATIKDVNNLEGRLNKEVKVVADLSARVDSVAYELLKNNIKDSLGFTDLAAEDSCIYQELASLDKQDQFNFDALRLKFAEKTGEVDSVENEIYCSVASKMNNWVKEHNDSTVERTGAGRIIGHNGNGLPKADCKDVAEYSQKDSILSQQVRRMAYSAILGKEVSDQDVVDLAYKVAIFGYNSDNVDKVAAGLFNDYAKSHARFGVGKNRQTHEQYMNINLRAKIDSIKNSSD